MQKQFKQTIKANKSDLSNESDNLETDQKGFIKNLAVLKKTVENFSSKVTDRLNK